MRLPRVQFTVRRMMAAVAMVAVACSALGHPGVPQPVKATSSDPKIATRQEKVLHGVLWGMSYEQARERAERNGRPILIFFSGINDGNSRLMELEVLPRADVVPLLSRFVTVQLLIDYAPIHSLKPAHRERIGENNAELEIAMTNTADSPTFVVMDAFGNVLASQGGTCKASDFIGFLTAAESAFMRRSGVARMRSWQAWTYWGLLFGLSCFISIGVTIRLKRTSIRLRMGSTQSIDGTAVL
jgi:hypothetical protein